MKNELLEKIEKLFWQNAFSELSMDQIATDLEMKKASLYYHFPSKEEMFLEVLEYSYKKYTEFNAEVLLYTEPKDIIRTLIHLPHERTNLFSIISQKGYCSQEKAMLYIKDKNLEIEEIYCSYFATRFGFSRERTIIFKALTDELSKKYCMFTCFADSDIEGLITEIDKIFFDK